MRPDLNDFFQRNCEQILTLSLMENNIINMGSKVSTSWVISSNPEVYDSITAFRELKTVDWQQSERSSFKPGDFVYIFVSHKVEKSVLFCHKLQEDFLE